MATKVFNATSAGTTVFRAGTAKVTIGTSTAIFTDVQITFSRQMGQIPVLGDHVVMSAQRPQGTIVAGAILTKSDGLLEKFAGGKNECSESSMTITFENSGTCTTGNGKNMDGKTTINLKGVFCSSVTFTVQGQNGFVGENFQAVFSEMDVS